MIPQEPKPPRITPTQLYLTFAGLTLHSIGGALFWVRRLVVERRRWLTEQEFVELVALAQLLPGVNGVNMTVLIGFRFGGLAGAAAACAGFLSPPILITVALGVLHQRYGALPLVQDALAGMAAVAVGLLIVTGVKLAQVLQRRRLPWLFVALTFAGVGILRWPLLAVVAALAPIAVAAAWRGRH
jgi:chromate transporter